jgi:hypothetical protein bacD2_23304
MFNDDYGLTQAVLDGRKTMTRRIIKCPRTFRGEWVAGFNVHIRQSDKKIVDYPCMYDADGREFDGGEILPKYKIGEVVAIAQSYKDAGYDTHDTFGECRSIGSYPGWKNKRFVKAEYMPRHISITNIKIERLQDISDEDCIREGVVTGTDRDTNMPFYGIYDDVKDIGYPFYSPREAFAALIDKISGRGTWNNNLYTFAYEFELID